MSGELCGRCFRPIADDSDLANDREGVCYDVLIQKDLEKLRMTNDSEPSCREVVLTEALRETCDTIEVLLLDAKTDDVEHCRSSLVNWRALLPKKEG